MSQSGDANAAIQMAGVLGAYIDFSNPNTVNNNLDFRQIYSVSANTLTFQSSSTDPILTMKAGGNVGIASSTPFGKLSVTQTGIAGAPAFIVEDEANDMTPFFIHQDGTVGIGTTTPGAPLEVTSGAGTNTNLRISADVNNWQTLEYAEGNTVIWSMGAHFSSNDFSIRPGVIGTTNYLTIADTTGNVFLSDTWGINSKLNIGTFGGDADIAFSATSTSGYATSTWVMGIDRSDSGKFKIASSTALGNSDRFVIDGTGKIGIGTASPAKTFDVQGTARLGGLSNNGTANYVCSVAATGEIATSSTACAPSSLRFKENIEPITYGVADVMKLRPVSFNYREDFMPTEWDRKRIGFIAEEMIGVIPEVVGLDTEGLPSNLDYPTLTALLTKAVQEQQGEISDLRALIASTTIATTTPLDTSSWLAAALEYVLNAFKTLVVQIGELVVGKTTATEVYVQNALTAQSVHTQTLCLDDICVTRDQLQALLAGQGSISGNVDPSVDGEPLADTEPPVITILGNNPAEIELGAIYGDLGVTVTDNVDTNLGYSVEVDGVAVAIDAITIDTSVASDHAIVYTATDTAGNSASSTRTVNVYDPNATTTPVTP